MSPASIKPLYLPPTVKIFPESGESLRLFLRPLRSEDITERYLDWFRDGSEVVEFLESRNFTRNDTVALIQAGEESKIYRLYAVCLKENGQHIGNMKLGEVSWRDGVSNLVTVIGDRSEWGKGYATEVIRIGNALAFEQMKLRKLAGSIYESNIGSLKAYLSAGWCIEGLMHRQFLRDGREQDQVMVACFNPAYFSQLPSFPKSLDVYYSYFPKRNS